MKRFMKRMHQGERGFTLIELLIVIAILGIIAAIVVPNVAGFMVSGQLNAANTEVQNVKTAEVGYLAEHGTWPTSSDDLVPYLSGTIKATYTFSANTITAATPIASGGWPTSIKWDATTQTWVRA